ncbi:glycosyltransferase 87 family protein [Rothia sp. AR01]|uniref:Glycosyltransferase 87 family protein n=1 Tax=Rothia santali TaxID=2949643 RepID=A0A9X2HFX4_9MICC|nr:glycosyltransferase 87 family protein [Rothia santali]MCP3426604.1 glycosyltransferase 87 family protein [Rothia santali]
MSPATAAPGSHEGTRATPRRSWQVVAWIVVVAVLGGQFWHAMTVGGLDFTVYRAGATTIFGNDGMTLDLYERNLIQLTADSYLPFTYPPFAALLLLPFAFIPSQVGVAIMVLFSMAVAWWISTLIVDYVNARGRKLPLQDKLGRTTTIALLTALICLSGPWRRGLGLVQINPLIMLLVLWDLVRPATRVPRGLFIGIAGGIKLTPLAFGLILLMRKDLKGLITLGITFAATVGLGFLLLPRQAVEFWTHAVSDPSRVGNINYLDNISIQGWLMHFGLTGDVLKVAMYVLIAVLLVGVAAAIPVLEKRRMRMSVVALTAFLMLQMSPISWSHHNTWLPIILTAACLDAFPWVFSHPGPQRRIALVLAWIGFVGLYISPMWIGVALYGSTEYLDYIDTVPLVVSAIPILCLFLFTCLWIWGVWRRRREPVTDPIRWESLAR